MTTGDAPNDHSRIKRRRPPEDRDSASVFSRGARVDDRLADFETSTRELDGPTGSRGFTIVEATILEIQITTGEGKTRSESTKTVSESKVAHPDR